MNKIDEIRYRADRYRGKAAGAKANVYCEDIDTLIKELENMRNELCNRCGLYAKAHEGACNWCKWRNKLWG